MRIVTGLVTTWFILPVPLLWAQPASVASVEPGSATGPPLPPVELNFRPWVVQVSGEVTAREAETPIAATGPFRLREDLGISAPDVYLEGELRVRLTPRGLASRQRTRRFVIGHPPTDGRSGFR